jgi:hypothetical protein
VLMFGLGDLLMAALFGWALLSHLRRERQAKTAIQDRSWSAA